MNYLKRRKGYSCSRTNLEYPTNCSLICIWKKLLEINFNRGKKVDNCFFQIINLSSGSFKCKLELRGWCENSFRRTRFLPIVLKVRFCLFWLNDFCTTLRNAFWFTSALNFFSCSFFSSFNSERKFLVDWVLKTDALILFVLK